VWIENKDGTAGELASSLAVFLFDKGCKQMIKQLPISFLSSADFSFNV